MSFEEVVTEQILADDSCGRKQDSSEGLLSEQDDIYEDISQEVEEVSESNLQLCLSAKVSALLFVSPRALSVAQIAEAAQANIEEVKNALNKLSTIYKEEVHGFFLLETAGTWQLRTSASAAKTIQRLVPSRARRLTKAAAETLAVIAYKQPVQRAEVEAIRGVDALPTLKTLLDARLIRIVGRADSAGHPALYGTTEQFLHKFGLRDLSQLPTIRELKEFDEEPGEVSLVVDNNRSEMIQDLISG